MVKSSCGHKISDQLQVRRGWDPWGEGGAQWQAVVDQHQEGSAEHAAAETQRKDVHRRARDLVLPRVEQAPDQQTVWHHVFRQQTNIEPSRENLQSYGGAANHCQLSQDDFDILHCIKVIYSRNQSTTVTSQIVSISSVLKHKFYLFTHYCSLNVWIHTSDRPCVLRVKLLWYCITRNTVLWL